MAEPTTKKIEREYTIPLRQAWLKAPPYKRTRKAIMEIKHFLAKHMKVTDRDISKIKLDVYFNNNLWFRGRKRPPAKVKVKAVKEGDTVKVDFIEIPQYVSHLKSKHQKLHKKVETQKTEGKEHTPEVEKKAEEERAKEKVTEQTKEEKEKEKSVADLNEKEADKKAKEEKHTEKDQHKDTPKDRLVLDRH